MTLGRGLILFVVCCLGLSAFAQFRGCHHCQIAAVGCKYSMETSEVDSGFGNQSNQPGDKIQRFKYDVGYAVAIGCFQFITYLTVARQ